MGQEEKQRVRPEEAPTTLSRAPVEERVEQRQENSAVKQQKKIRVKVAQLGARVVEVEGDDNMTVAEALSRAKINPGELELRINNKRCDLMAKLHDGDILMLVGRYKGGPAMLLLTAAFIALTLFAKTTWIIPGIITLIIALYLLIKKRVPEVRG